jgi:hypothetical protein
MVESFWAIPDVANMRTPLSILREQASALTAQTKGVLVGVVETHSERDKLLITLDISVPALNDYRYRILNYRQPIEIYPGLMYSGDAPSHIKNEDAFIECVKEILSSDRMKNALTSLLSQAAEPDGGAGLSHVQA